MSPLRLQRAARRGRAGYTLVELMMALALFTVAVLGIISLQKLMVVASAHAKNVSVAERIAQSWATQLQLDSASWRATNTGTNWLGGVGGGWVRPAYVGGVQNFGAAFDALGNPLSETSGDLARARYCTHVRLSWLYPQNLPVTGNGLMRAEIRVFWLRDGESNINTAGICQAGVATATIGQAVDRYHFVYHTTGIRQRLNI
jgi:prepilin-type N-terminal cleavage/methylation domain-containing protein